MYQVKILNGVPTVVDQQGAPIHNARVHKIKFPKTIIDTADGPVGVISGPATAVISVNGKVYSGVPVV